MRARVLRFLGWASLTAVVLAIGALILLSTPLGRAGAANAFGALLSSRIHGTARFSTMTRLDFEGVEMTDFSVTSPSGDRVIQADRLSGNFAWLASLESGALVLTAWEMEGGELRITRGPSDQIDLIHSMEVPDDRFMIPLEMRDLRMLHQRVTFSLPGAPAIEMEDVSGLLDVSVGHTFSVRLDQLHGYADVPVVHIGFERLEGRLRSDDPAPLVVRMVLDLEIVEPSMELRYTAPAVVGDEGAPGLGIELGVDVPDERHVARPRSPEAAEPG